MTVKENCGMFIFISKSSRTDKLSLPFSVHFKAGVVVIGDVKMYHFSQYTQSLFLYNILPLNVLFKLIVNDRVNE